jgi:2-keto-4-pentenoate hydratase/2-oxohepta-3-ene-1,7-dioic acid hydratase in catechol pathway
MRLATITTLASGVGGSEVAPGTLPGGGPALEVAIVLEDGAALTLSGLARISGWPVSAGIARLSLAELLTADPELASIRQAFGDAAAGAVSSVALAPGSFRFAAPIPRPAKAIGVGFNYAEHLREQGRTGGDRPVLFSMFANAVVGEGEPIRRPAGTHALDLEAELAIVIGRRASRVAREEALACVAGYTCANDVTARNWQGQKQALGPDEKGDGQWLRAKGSDTFLPIGPVLVTADELGDGKGLRLRSWVTRTSDPAGGVGDAAPPAGAHVDPASAAAESGPGEPLSMQDGNTDDLIFDVPAIISMISREVTLEPGDVIATGTPSGVGVFRDPPIFLVPGDLVRIEVERIGSLTNPITDEDGHVPADSPAARFLAGR